MTKIITIALSLSLCSLCCQSQDLSKRTIKDASYKVAELVKANYVLKDKGNDIAASFIKDFEKGRFNFAASWKQLDSVMTKSLREVSNDGHLYVWHNLEIVKELKGQTEEKKEETSEETTSFFNNKKAYDSNFGFQQLEILEGNVGYMKLSQINISAESLKTLYAAMEFIKNTHALIIDLRNNGGGGSTVGAVFETFFLEKETELLEFKNRTGSVEMNKTVGWLLGKKYTKPLYILTNSGTASAAEAFTFALQNLGRATVVGTPSAGAAFMNQYYLVNDQLIVSVSSDAPFLPGTQISWQGTGIQPNVAANDDEAREKALQHIKGRLGKE
ncbi:S41 family peptidase [uncultured Imperialibacter sp.]|uniref:S41 family peptidase n=1 Tax=uncultured Imperialibacter sp. TaxID=1672639 RepID=UPI0030D8D2CF|tara:strand:- start:26780 stop:27769 length:990 start_codon:yes stop_codon:yes gene_type:complete